MSGRGGCERRVTVVPIRVCAHLAPLPGLLGSNGSVESLLRFTQVSTSIALLQRVLQRVAMSQPNVPAAAVAAPEITEFAAAGEEKS